MMKMFRYDVSGFLKFTNKFGQSQEEITFGDQFAIFGFFAKVSKIVPLKKSPRIR